MSDPVRIGVVGLGMMGAEHARILSQMPGASLRGCADPRSDASASAPAGVPVYAAADELIAAGRLDALVVATPEEHHRAAVIAGLRAGLDVLVEKPLATTLADADAMIAAAQEHGRRLAVGHVLRFDARYTAVADAIAQERIGDIVHVTARRNCPVAEGRLAGARSSLALYMSVHDVDVLQWYAGPIVEVYARASEAGVSGGPDSIVATLAFASGAVGTLETSWALPDASGLEWDCACSVVGRAGCAYVDVRAMGVEVLSGVAGSRYPDTSYWAQVAGLSSGALRTELEHFVRAVADGGAPVLDAPAAREALRATLAIETSLNQQRPIRVEDLQ